ncbi:DNA mismatch repair endonuclease MutL [Trichocoleus sp. FACHB-591]|uniref:DNA mismatch repair endonuclease MutL n=1 Tax=Trichocoleus sp. FACHB-591 TaxID=2692872 RepID=UPI0016887B03|nr:DNA mismatch repair endonuclease MutL [Trichocoleus sp. FACHB-591]MBD2098698.1 DNA mismatch repair endonuclease MutL [Trichocoleus sp. FACHB-591]
MAPRIQTLPLEVVHLIAAGEVIDSLAAVVRELVENALDAGATRIAIALWPEQWRVRVADNGAGMDLADLKQAATPHSTSKIQASEDLWKITSLGFRGEALHSLAQLAELEVLSRLHSNQAGWQVSYNTQGEAARVEPVAIAPGTVVTASNLFGIWPARREGLPSPAQQLRSIQLTIHQIALCHPHVTWQVEQSDRPWFSIWSGEDAKPVLAQILRSSHLSDLHAIAIASPRTATIPEIPNPDTSNPEKLQLVLGLPDRCHRRRPDWVRVAINGRIVKAPELEQTILAAFRRTLPRDRYPVCFAHLQVPPNHIDWNRHPAKAEVYLHHLSDWQEAVTQAIAQALHFSPAQLNESYHSERVGQLLKVAEADGVYQVSRTIPVETETTVTTDDSTNPTVTNLLELRAVAQVSNTYIVAEHPAGMWLVEQHIAHERVLYEQLCDRWHLVPLEPPVILNNLSAPQREQLQRLGLEVEPFGEQLWAIRTAPDLLGQREDCPAALWELSLGGDLESALVATACRSAIRNGTPLTLPEMQTLLDQWQQTHRPHTCPHGRPIYLSLEETALSRFFRRHWVIGKSHGI